MPACCDQITLDVNVLCAILGTSPTQVQDGTIALFGRNGIGDCVYTNETPWVGVAGNGITIVPGGVNGHGPTITARISTDANNCTVFGTDGGIYTPCVVETPWTGTGTGLVVITPGGVAGHAPVIDVSCEAVQDCVSPMMLGNGFVYDDAGNQWDTTGAAGTYLTSTGAGGAVWTAPILPPAETPWIGTASGLVTITPGGPFGHSPTIGVSCAAVQACVGPIPPAPLGWTSGAAAGDPCSFSTYAGGVIPNGGAFNIIGFGGVILFGAAPNLGIGLNLGANAWPFGCADSNGMPIYCTTTGLRTNPDHSTVVTPRNVAATAGSPGVGISNFAITGVAFNNPNPCRSMGVLMHYGYGSSVTDLPGGNTGTDWDFNIAGSPGYNGTFQFFQINPNAGTTQFGPERVSMQSMNWDQFVIGPGAGFVTVITSAATPQVGAGVDCTTFAVISGFGTTL